MSSLTAGSHPGSLQLQRFSSLWSEAELSSGNLQAQTSKINLVTIAVNGRSERTLVLYLEIVLCKQGSMESKITETPVYSRQVTGLLERILKVRSVGMGSLKYSIVEPTVIISILCSRLSCKNCMSVTNLQQGAWVSQ